MADQTGYSNTSLVKKLGIKPGFKIRLIDPPEHYFNLLEGIPIDTEFFEEPETGVDFIHYFTQQASELENRLPALKAEIVSNGMIWVSWPKKASKVPTDVQRRCDSQSRIVDGTCGCESMRGRCGLVRIEAGNKG